jgi:hypothetical protein
LKRIRPAGIVAAAALAFGLGIGTTPSVHAQLPPARFFGSATMGGQAAPAGTEVRAYIGGNECGMGTVNDAGTYVVDVKTLSEDAPYCGYEGVEVTFTIAGQNAFQTGSFQTGYFLALNLSLDGPVDQPPPLQPSSDAPPEQPQPEAPPEDAPPSDAPPEDPPPSDAPPEDAPPEDAPPE